MHYTIQLPKFVFSYSNTENLKKVEAASIRVISMTQVKNDVNKNDFTGEDINENYTSTREIISS